MAIKFTKIRRHTCFKSVREKPFSSFFNFLSFYTWGNSGLEPYLGSGNQLSSIDEARRWALQPGRDCNGALCWTLDVSLKLTAICIVDRTGKIEREGVVSSDPEAIAIFINRMRRMSHGLS